MAEDDMVHPQDARKRSGANPNTDLQFQIVEAVRAGLEHYHDRKDTVDAATVERLREDMRDGFRTVNERLDRVDSSLLQGTSRFAVSDTKIARIEKDIEDLKRKSPTAPLPVIRESKAESHDEPPMVSQKFWNAVWLGIAGSIGAGVVAGAVVLSRSAADPQASTPAPVSRPAVPAPTPAPVTP